MKEDWEIKKLVEVCKNLDNKRKPVTKHNRVEGKYPYYGASGIVDYVDEYIFDDELLLISEDGANLLARTYPIAFSINGKTWVNNHAHVLKFDSSTTQHFIEYYLNSIKLDAFISGMAQPKLNQQKLNSIPIPIPSLPEQQHIVSILDEAFAAIDQAKANLERNLQNAKELFQSELNSVLSQKGEDWVEKKLSKVCAKITDGTHQTPTYFEDGVLFLSSKNVTTGKINWDDIKYIDSKQHTEMHKRVAPRLNDILLAKNGTTGVAAMVDRDVVFDIYVSLALIRVLDEVLPSYMLYFINSPIAKKQFNKRLKGIGVPNLHLEEIREVVIPFPKSLDEQQGIVSQLDNLSNQTKKLEKIYQHKLNELESLKKSILQKAFSGELSNKSTVSKQANIPITISDISQTDLHAGIIALSLKRHEDANAAHTFHHVKSEKIVHLIESHLGIDLGRSPLQDAAGPNDYPLKMKVESRAQKAGFFYVNESNGIKNYTKGSQFEKLISKVNNSLQSNFDGVYKLIDLIVPMTTQQAEIVATVYAAWNNLLLENKDITNETIVTEARENWHKNKLNIPREKFFGAITWMKENNLVPKGTGKKVVKKA